MSDEPTSQTEKVAKSIVEEGKLAQWQEVAMEDMGYPERATCELEGCERLVPWESWALR